MMARERCKPTDLQKYLSEVLERRKEMEQDAEALINRLDGMGYQAEFMAIEVEKLQMFKDHCFHIMKCETTYRPLPEMPMNRNVEFPRYETAYLKSSNGNIYERHPLGHSFGSRVEHYSDCEQDGNVGAKVLPSAFSSIHRREKELFSTSSASVGMDGNSTSEDRRHVKSVLDTDQPLNHPTLSGITEFPLQTESLGIRVNADVSKAEEIILQSQISGIILNETRQSSMSLDTSGKKEADITEAPFIAASSSSVPSHKTEPVVSKEVASEATSHHAEVPGSVGVDKQSKTVSFEQRDNCDENGISFIVTENRGKSTCDDPLSKAEKLTISGEFERDVPPLKEELQNASSSSTKQLTFNNESKEMTAAVNSDGDLKLTEGEEIVDLGKADVSKNGGVTFLEEFSTIAETEVKQSSSASAADKKPGYLRSSVAVSDSENSEISLGNEVPITSSAAYQSLIGAIPAPERKQLPQFTSGESDSEDDVEKTLAMAVHSAGPKVEKNPDAKGQMPQALATTADKMLVEKKPAYGQPRKSISAASGDHKHKMSKATRKILGLGSDTDDDGSAQNKAKTKIPNEDSDEFDFFD